MRSGHCKEHNRPKAAQPSTHITAVSAPPILGTRAPSKYAVQFVRATKNLCWIYYFAVYLICLHKHVHSCAYKQLHVCRKFCNYQLWNCAGLLYKVLRGPSMRFIPWQPKLLLTEASVIKPRQSSLQNRGDFVGS